MRMGLWKMLEPNPGRKHGLISSCFLNRRHNITSSCCWISRLCRFPRSYTRKNQCHLCNIAVSEASAQTRCFRWPPYQSSPRPGPGCGSHVWKAIGGSKGHWHVAQLNSWAPSPYILSTPGRQDHRIPLSRAEPSVLRRPGRVCGDRLDELYRIGPPLSSPFRPCI